ncbi:MAG: hypothetical protein AABY26_04090 [Nanoarchaeota archaeon]
MNNISTSRIQAFFNRFPLLEKVVTILNAAHIPFAIGGSGCLFLLGNKRLPDDVDIYLHDERHDEADSLFKITSFVYRSAQEEVRNSNPERNHSIQLTSKLILNVGGKKYNLSLDSMVLSRCLQTTYKQQKVFLYPPEDVLLIKALLQRGPEVGKQDLADIQAFLNVYPHLRMDYLKKRITLLGAEKRVEKVFLG